LFCRSEHDRYLDEKLEFQGKGIVEAALEACRLRLRPIVMTSVAFIAGMVPLVLSHGAGVEVRSAKVSGLKLVQHGEASLAHGWSQWSECRNRRDHHLNRCWTGRSQADSHGFRPRFAVPLKGCVSILSKAYQHYGHNQVCL
jgi:AcrB/AcrD/AcrF family